MARDVVCIVSRIFDTINSAEELEFLIEEILTELNMGLITRNEYEELCRRYLNER